MDSKEFKKAIAVLVKEKGISEDVIYEAMRLALTSAYKKNYHSLSNVRVDINEETGEISVYSFRTVVPDNYEELEEWNLLDEENDSEEDGEGKEPFIFDERIHIPLTEAREIVPGIEVGETIEEEVTPKDFGRVAAATAKQVVIQKIREAERNSIALEFGDKQDELVSGTVEMEDARNYYIDLGKTQGILPKTEIIPGETIKMGSNIKVYITKVDNGSKGCTILLSRCHYGFVKRLFELEIPEINEGIILVHSVARDAGNRTKVALESTNDRVDAIGSCIGERGMRIANILKELNGEKVDLVLYDNDASKFIENALSPAKNIHVFITDEKKNEALVVTDNDNLSLAIGKKGSNIKLAARLTHYKIDVKTYDQAKEMGINIYED
ncbi:MAG: transcription termination factor NusA [Bacilli bacterium]